MATLISVPAGRCHRRSPDSKWVDPQPEKGLIEMKFEDDLMHLWWKNRNNGSVEDELIVFPGEATFEKVQQDPSGRTHILKFSSSDQSYFFWFQRANKASDLRAQVDLNAFLQDPSYRAGSAPLPEPAVPSTPQASSSAQPAPSERSWPPTPGAPRLSHPEPLPPSNPSGNSAAQASTTDGAGGAGSNAASSGSSGSSSAASTQEEMARLLVQWAQAGGLGAAGASRSDDVARLTDVLSPANITALVKSDPTIGSRLKPLLPAALNLPDNPSAQDLIPVLTAPQLTDAIASLDNALRSGGLPGGMMRDIGLPESAGQSVSAFLEALKGLNQPKTSDDDRMETDD